MPEDPEVLRRQLAALQQLRDLEKEKATRVSMRFAHYRDRPVDFVHDVLGDKTWSKQAQILESLWTTKRVVVPSCFASGKALDVDTRIPTPSGWSTMSQLSPGDEVFDEAGKPCTVVAKSPVWERDCYRVTFDDGSELVTADVHEWSALSWRSRHGMTESRRRNGRVTDWRQHWAMGQTVTTEEMAADTWRQFSTVRQANWGIPTAAPLQGQRSSLPVDPYALGVWLGDGCRRDCTITVGADDREGLVEQLEANGSPIHSVRPGGGSNSVLNVVGQYRDLRLAGLRNNKHIPDAYLRASVDQRLALLQGVMDTDGTAGKNAAVAIDLCNERLAQGVAELVRTFGWKLRVRKRPATLKGRVVGSRWRMTFTPDLPVFRLERKRRAQVFPKTARATLRTVARVEPVPSVPTQCIEVDSPSHLFLAGEGFVPTHNSWTAARAVLAWVATDPHAIAITTAPSWRQVETILWGECRKAWKPELPGNMAPKAPTWYVTPSNWARGFSTDDPTRFQGYHEGRVLVVMDEAAGVDNMIYEAMQGLLAGGETAALLIGNPVEAAGDFYNHAILPDWECLPISVFDTPNLIGAGGIEAFYSDPEGAIARCVVANPSLVTPEWVLARYKEWGPESPQWQSKVLGDFPDLGERIIIPISLIQKAQGRIFSHAEGDRTVMGLDIARFGSDASAVCIRRGPAVLHLERKHGFDGPEVAGWATALCRRFGVGTVHGDAGGLGGPVLDIMRRNDLVVVDVNASGKPRNKEEYLNARAEMWWGLRQRFVDGEIAIVRWSEASKVGSIEPEIAVLRSQLASLRYQYNGQGKVQVEAKEDAAKRGIKSPDLADAACLAFYSPSGAVTYLDAIAPACAACGQRNRRADKSCRKCGVAFAQAS